MTPGVMKTIIAVTLLVEILVFIGLYRIKKCEKYHSYFYLLGTISILCGLAFLCFDSKLFVAEHELKFYVIEFLIFVSIELVAYLIMLITRIVLSKKKNKIEQ